MGGMCLPCKMWNVVFVQQEHQFLLCLRGVSAVDEKITACGLKEHRDAKDVELRLACGWAGQKCSEVVDMR